MRYSRATLTFGNKTIQRMTLALFFFVATSLANESSFILPNELQSFQITLSPIQYSQPQYVVKMLDRGFFSSSISDADDLKKANALLVGTKSTIPPQNLLQAQEIIQDVLEDEPNNKTANALLAFLHIHNNRKDSSIALMRKSIVINNNNRDLLKEFGIVLTAYQRYHEALDFLTLAQSENSQDSDVHFYSSICYYNMRKYKEAEKQLQSALHISPRHTQALSILGWTQFVFLDNTRSGTDYLEKSLTIDSTSLYTQTNLALCYLQLKRLDEAEKLFLLLLSNDFDNINAHLGLIAVYKSRAGGLSTKRMADLIHAINHLEILTTMNPNSIPYLVNLAQARDIKGEIEQAIDICETAHYLNEKDAVVKMTLINYYDKYYRSLMDTEKPNSEIFKLALSQVIKSLGVLPLRTQVYNQKYLEYSTIIQKIIQYNKAKVIRIDEDLDMLMKEFTALKD